MSANFEEFLEKITFAIEYTIEDQTATDAAPFLAMVRANQDLLAARLAEAATPPASAGSPRRFPSKASKRTTPGRS